MPTYQYQCAACGKEFEEYQSIKAKPIRKCPHCGKNKVKRMIGTGVGLIFKGSGFYLTDYRSESYKKAAQAEKGGGGESTKSEAKSSSGEGKKSGGGESAKSESKSSSGDTKKSGGSGSDAKRA